MIGDDILIFQMMIYPLAAAADDSGNDNVAAAAHFPRSQRIFN